MDSAEIIMLKKEIDNLQKGFDDFVNKTVPQIEGIKSTLDRIMEKENIVTSE